MVLLGLYRSRIGHSGVAVGPILSHACAVPGPMDSRRNHTIPGIHGILFPITAATEEGGGESMHSNSHPDLHHMLCVEYADDLIDAIVVDRHWLRSEVTHHLWENDIVEWDLVEQFVEDDDARRHLGDELADRFMGLMRDLDRWQEFHQGGEENAHLEVSRIVVQELPALMHDEGTFIEILAKVAARKAAADEASRTPKPEFPITILNERTGLIAEPMEVVVCRA